MAEDNFSNIISNFKNMISNNSSDNTNKTHENSSNLNITPEMIGNIANMLKSNQTTEEPNNSSADVTPESSSDSFNTKSSDNSQHFDPSSIDIDTILKIKNIMETLNKKGDPRSNLLYSLKPYLRESKQKKLDQYVNLFKITQITQLFKNEKGAKN